MTKIRYFLLLALLLSLYGCNKEEENPKSDFNIITDDLHKSFKFETPPQRVITLAPNLTEMIFKLNVEDKLIGNTKYCNYPDSAKRITKVGDLLTVDLEKIVSLNPDLIFITVEGNSKSDYQKLLDLGMKVFVSNPRNYSGIKKTLSDMAKIFHKEKLADSLINNWNLRLAEIKKTHNMIEAKKVLFLISKNPLFTVGGNSFINQILTFSGLENISADSKVNYPIFNREEIVKRNPDYILLYKTNKNDINKLLELYPEWNTISAVVNKRVFFIDADLYSRPGPRFVNAVEELNSLVLKR